MLIDTHCHLDASEFNHDRQQIIRRSIEAGVASIIIPAVMPSNFAAVRDCAHGFAGGYYALGIHPMYVPYCQPPDLDILRDAVEVARFDPKFVGIGEIGLDFFVSTIASGESRQQQEYFYQEQLKIARQFNLPVILHVRRSQDSLLKYLRRISVPGGFAHAFNGSDQQAQNFIDLGFCLGFGGSMTYTRALQIRRLATNIDLNHLVLETDAPDIPPAFLSPEDRRNQPQYLRQIAQQLADLRQLPLAQITQITSANVRRVMPSIKLV